VIGFDGHNRIKGSKVHALVITPQSLPATIDLGPGNEHESRKLFPLLKDIKLGILADQGADQSGFMATISTIHNW
jgi:hypothetical protein